MVNHGKPRKNIIKPWKTKENPWKTMEKQWKIMEKQGKSLDKLIGKQMIRLTQIHLLIGENPKSFDLLWHYNE